MVKNPPANAGVRSPGQEDPLQKEEITHSSIYASGNPMDSGAWWARAHGVAKESDTS